MPTALRWINQRRFTLLHPEGVSDEPRLITADAPVYGEQLDYGRFMVHQYRGRSCGAHRAGILRPCAYVYLFKNYTLKDWVVFNERYAMPLRVGKYTPGASEEERRVLKQAVFNLRTDAAAVISDSTVIELLDSAQKGTSADIYASMVEFCDRSMTKAVLGHAGNADSTAGKLGAEHEAREVRQHVDQPACAGSAPDVGGCQVHCEEDERK